MDGNISRLRADLEAALPGLSKAVLSQPVDELADAKVVIRPVMLHAGRCYQVERFRGGKAFHQNLGADELLRMFSGELDGRYRQALIASDDGCAQYALRAKGGYKRTSHAAAARPGAAQPHNREKRYILAEGENIPALVDLGIFTADLRIVKAKYDKYKQINRFIELVDDELSKSDRREITVLDFGCGKSYLTFILYYYFTVKRGMNAKIIGYDLKEDVVARCNAVAGKYGYTGLRFVHADVTRDVLYDEHIDMIVTLHACDTATDYALANAVNWNTDYILAVPCCQHELNGGLDAPALRLMTKYGILKERFATLATDALRARALEGRGYKTDVSEFIDIAHSPKNILIRAKRAALTDAAAVKRMAEAKAEIETFCQMLGYTPLIVRLLFAEH